MELPNKAEGPPKRKKIEPVVTGVVPATRPATRRFKDFLFAESPKELTGKIGRDIVVPRLKSGLEEALNSFLSGMLWGGTQRPISSLVSRTSLPGGGINYNNIPLSGNTPAVAQPQQRASGNYQDLVCPSVQSAELLLANLLDVYNSYRVVTVADLYEMANITPQPSDNSYGWHTLDQAQIIQDRRGVVLTLPKPSLI